MVLTIRLVDTLLHSQPVIDLNHTEQNQGGAYVPVAILPSSSDILLAKMEARMPINVFEEVTHHAIGVHRLTARMLCIDVDVPLLNASVAGAESSNHSMSAGVHHHAQ